MEKPVDEDHDSTSAIDITHNHSLEKLNSFNLKGVQAVNDEKVKTELEI